MGGECDEGSQTWFQTPLPLLPVIPPLSALSLPFSGSGSLVYRLCKASSLCDLNI